MKAGFAKLMMVAAIAVVAVIAGSAAAWAQCPASPSYSPNFTNSQSCLDLNGSASFPPTNGSAASITSWSNTSGTVTFNAPNGFSVGEMVTLSGFSTTTSFNGLAFSVLSAGESSFQVYFAQFANTTTSGTESGTATPLSVLQLTPNETFVAGVPPQTATYQAGSAWFNTQQSITNGFSTTFRFQISNPNATSDDVAGIFNADGLAFLVQNSSTTALGSSACGMGFADDTDDICQPQPPTSGISNSVAVAFKSYDDGYTGDGTDGAVYPNTANSVSILSNRTAPNCVNDDESGDCVIAVNNSLQLAGTVNTSGGTVTWVSGSYFSTSWAPGTQILINGLPYPITNVVSTTSLNVGPTVSGAPPGTLTGVAYSVGANVTGMVNTDGTTVTFVTGSGSPFNTNWAPGTQIFINGAYYSIANVASTTSLTLYQPAGESENVPYSVGIILQDGYVHTGTVTYTATPTLSASPNCFTTDGVALPCLDVILDGVDLFSGGVPFNLTTIGLASETSAWVGFTAGTGAYNDDHDILDWTFTPQSQSQSGTVTPGQTSPTVFPFYGGCDLNAEDDCTNNGYDFTIQETSNSSNQPVQVVVTAIPIISGSGTAAENQAACNTIVQANSLFDTNGAPAQCFVIQNGGGPGVDAPVFFQVECPESPGGSCGAGPTADFYATLGIDYSFSCAENPTLGAQTSGQCIEPGSTSTSFGFPNNTSLTFLPEIGFLDGSGPDSTQACAPYPNNSPALFESNQVLSFVLGPGDNGGGAKGSSGGTGSCWTLTYQTEPEWPTINITTPSQGQMIAQGAAVAANYTCTPDTTVTSSNPTPATGPYLTITSCTGPVASGSDISTSTPGPNTFTVNAEDSADNTNTQTVTYYVVGGSQTITFTTNAPSSAAYNSMFSVAATATSGLSVTFTSSGACTNSGATYTMTNSTGICYVYANQAGNSYYSAAPTVTETVNATGPLVSTTNIITLPGTTYYGVILPVIVAVNNPGTLTLDFTKLSLTLGSGTPTNAFTLLDQYAPYILCSSTLAAGKTCYVAIAFLASKVGTLSATLNMADNAPGSPQQLTFSVVVINPQVKFTPSSLSFGTIKHTTTSTLDVTLSNPGTTPLTINSIGVTGTNKANFTETNNCPSSLAANGSCTIAVTFNPGAVGTFSANLTVNDNALLNPQAVPLSGKGD